MFRWIVIAPILTAASAHAAAPDRASGIRMAQRVIKHVIVIMQENRSFDSYFGTYPGADGIALGACVPLNPAKPQLGCVQPFHDPHDMNAAGRHHPQNAEADIDNGVTSAKMDGFVFEQTQSGFTKCSPTTPVLVCAAMRAGVARHDVMGYHDRAEIPNYWAYAKHFVLQDQLYEGVRSWSWSSHVELTSEWTAQCADWTKALTCVTNPAMSLAASAPKPLPWVNLFQLFDAHGVTWKYYIDGGLQPDCEDGELACPPIPQASGLSSLWNPVPDFSTVQAAGSAYLAAHNPPLAQFYADLQGGTLPQVSWIVPSAADSEHGLARITQGMEYVSPSYSPA
jgi:phospholipase C